MRNADLEQSGRLGCHGVEVRFHGDDLQARVEYGTMLALRRVSYRDLLSTSGRCEMFRVWNDLERFSDCEW